MADVKISGLPASTTPLAGTEVLPIVQGGQTRQVSVNNLTAGKSVSAASFVPTSATIPTNGMFLGAANSVSIATNSTEHWMFNASGNFNPVGTKGIGTSAAPVGSLVATSVTTSPTTANLAISATTIASGGSNANVPVTIDPKGTGNVIIPNSSGNTWSHLNGGNSTANGAEPWLATLNNVDASAATFGWAFYNNLSAGDLDLYRRVSSTTGTLTMTFSRGTGNVTVSNGNLVIGTSGKGIDFSATAGTGTSELLADYEEGTWTPADASGAGLTLTVNSATYTKIGRIVTCAFDITYPSTANASGVKISGLPFTSASGHTSGYAHGYTDSNTAPVFLVLVNSGTMDGLNYNFSTSITNAQFSGKRTKGLVTYYV